LFAPAFSPLCPPSFFLFFTSIAVGWALTNHKILPVFSLSLLPKTQSQRPFPLASLFPADPTPAPMGRHSTCPLPVIYNRRLHPSSVSVFFSPPPFFLLIAPQLACGFCCTWGFLPPPPLLSTGKLREFLGYSPLPPPFWSFPSPPLTESDDTIDRPSFVFLRPLPPPIQRKLLPPFFVFFFFQRLLAWASFYVFAVNQYAFCPQIAALSAWAFCFFDFLFGLPPFAGSAAPRGLPAVFRVFSQFPFFWSTPRRGIKSLAPPLFPSTFPLASGRLFGWARLGGFFYFSHKGRRIIPSRAPPHFFLLPSSF